MIKVSGYSDSSRVGFSKDRSSINMASIQDETIVSRQT